MEINTQKNYMQNQCLKAKSLLETFSDKHEQLKLKLNNTADQMENVSFFLDGKNIKETSKDYNKKYISESLQHNEGCYNTIEEIQDRINDSTKESNCEDMIKLLDGIIDNLDNILSCVYTDNDNLSTILGWNNSYAEYNNW